MNETSSVFVGIDVSKLALDVAVRSSGTTLCFSNDEAGIAALVAEMKSLSPTLIVLEATGGFETPAVAALGAAHLPAAVWSTLAKCVTLRSLQANWPRPTRSMPLSSLTLPKQYSLRFGP